MNRQELLRLQAEKSAIENLLFQMPEENVIDRMSLDTRKRNIEVSIGSFQSSGKEPIKAKLTFRGKPVVESHGIFAEFGATAVNAFVETIATFAAASTGPLGARGNIPNRDEYRFLITGTALGSFGFELEEKPVNGKLPLDDSSLIEVALEKARNLMEASTGSDDDLAEAAAEVDPRGLAALQGFMKTLADHDAICALEFKDKFFKFRDVGQVRQGEQRLSVDNIREDEQTLDGSFQGVLPKKRTFEFQLAASAEIIHGRVGALIIDAGEINQILGKPVKISVLATRVRESRPRYVLMKYQESLAPALPK